MILFGDHQQQKPNVQPPRINKKMHKKIAPIVGMTIDVAVVSV